MKIPIKVCTAYMANNNMNNNHFRQSFKKQITGVEKEEKTPFQKVLNEKIKIKS